MKSKKYLILLRYVSLYLFNFFNNTNDNFEYFNRFKMEF